MMTQMNVTIRAEALMNGVDYSIICPENLEVGVVDTEKRFKKLSRKT